MPTIKMDKEELNDVITEYTDAKKRMSNSVKNDKFELDLGKTDISSVKKYEKAVEILRMALESYASLLEKDIENFKKVRETMELVDETIAEEVMG